MIEKRILTAIDANINRAVEGLRVCEDILRFSVKSADSVKFKEFRHAVLEVSREIPRGYLLDSRDVEGDGQKFVDLESEMQRNSLSDIFSANIHRAIEAVRSLEEFLKLVDTDHSGRMQKLRFNLYEIEKNTILLNMKMGKIDKLKNSIYAIIDSSFVNEDYIGAARRLISGGAAIIQLRMKSCPAGLVYNTAVSLSKLCSDEGVIFIVNDHPDIAYLAPADGVHLGQSDLPVNMARKILSSDALIGISTHSYEEAARAVKHKPDYIAVGPVFDTMSKNGKLLKGIGTDTIKRIRSVTDIPIVAIGGIKPDNISGVKKSGCDAFAVVSYLYENGNLEHNCRNLLKNI